MKKSLQLNFFPGFYETVFESCDTDYYAIRQELEYFQEENPNLTVDDLDFNFKDYRRDIINAFIDEWKASAPKDVVSNVEFDALDSPKYYNFRNDYLYGFVTFKDGWQDAMRKFMSENQEWLRDRIRREWSSRDGFISFMCNDLDYWGDYLFNEQDGRYLSSMIGYMMEIENPDICEHLEMATMEKIYDGLYVFVKNQETVESE
jgi:hypothetical protein